jgi:hypothetical protein
MKKQSFMPGTRQIPNSKFQISNKLQKPNFKQSGRSLWGLLLMSRKGNPVLYFLFEYWDFFGFCDLVLGISPANPERAGG